MILARNVSHHEEMRFREAAYKALRSPLTFLRHIMYRKVDRKGPSNSVKGATKPKLNPYSARSVLQSCNCSATSSCRPFVLRESPHPASQWSVEEVRQYLHSTLKLRQERVDVDGSALLECGEEYLAVVCAANHALIRQRALVNLRVLSLFEAWLGSHLLLAKCAEGDGKKQRTLLQGILRFKRPRPSPHPQPQTPLRSRLLVNSKAWKECKHQINTKKDSSAGQILNWIKLLEQKWELLGNQALRERLELRFPECSLSGAPLPRFWAGVAAKALALTVGKITAAAAEGFGASLQVASRQPPVYSSANEHYAVEPLHMLFLIIFVCRSLYSLFFGMLSFNTKTQDTTSLRCGL